MDGEGERDGGRDKGVGWGRNRAKGTWHEFSRPKYGPLQPPAPDPPTEEKDREVI